MLGRPPVNKPQHQWEDYFYCPCVHGVSFVELLGIMKGFGTNIDLTCGESQ